mmetsp:Transcript_11563/g.37859  ORF Transcript_11563/g.37859 Transcript_11563/m.37859 type:complete len:220 (+) Transcript_11563:134-793(+)
MPEGIRCESSRPSPRGRARRRGIGLSPCGATTQSRLRRHPSRPRTTRRSAGTRAESTPAPCTPAAPAAEAGCRRTARAPPTRLRPPPRVAGIPAPTERCPSRPQVAARRPPAAEREARHPRDRSAGGGRRPRVPPTRFRPNRGARVRRPRAAAINVGARQSHGARHTDPQSRPASPTSGGRPDGSGCASCAAKGAATPCAARGQGRDRAATCRYWPATR